MHHGLGIFAFEQPPQSCNRAIQREGRVMSETIGSQFEVVLVTALAVVLCVVVHYEALSYFTVRLRHIQLRPRPRILVLIFAILATHVAEIWIFGGAYFWLLGTEGHGTLLANHGVGLLDAVYFSAVCYTTLGLGDIVPSGAIRFLVGTESLSGFVLLTWSASFTYFEMERFWRR
jgi:hypothetical protein